MDTMTDSADLTERQLKILEVIRDSIQRQGVAPCFREIGEAVGLSSKSSVSYQISQLQELGYLRRSTGPRQPLRLAD
jgi:repressor LexA